MAQSGTVDRSIVGTGALRPAQGAPRMQRGGWLDALRLITACLIVVHHYRLASPVALDSLHPVFDRGHLLTNLFLVDSGYVLARIYARQVASGALGFDDFWLRRALRVFPAHLMMVGVLVAVVVAASLAGISPDHGEWFRWSELPAQVLLVQAWAPLGGHGWNAPAWSLSALLVCYAAFPLLVRGVGRMGAFTALAVAAAVILFGNLATEAVLHEPLARLPLSFGVWRALPLFFLGVALAAVSERVTLSPRTGRWMMGLSVAAAAALQLHGPHSLLVLALTAVLILGAAAVPVARSNRLFEVGGLAAFSIFISNEVVRIVYFGLADALQARLNWSTGLDWLVWALGVTGAVVFGFVFYMLVDKPSQAAVQGWLRAREGRRVKGPTLEETAPAI